MTIKLKDLVDSDVDITYCHECDTKHDSDIIYLQYHK